ncbi:TonB-dependent receptor [SAR92 clade bacterium H231]|nr:TonB-dependent receptor [SAR92 clade bacterium H231]
MFDVVWGKNANQSSISNAHMKRAVGEEGRLSFYHAVAMLALVCCLYSNSSYAVKDDNIPFNIPQQRADLALTEFAEQANLTLVFPFDQVKDKTANRLVGYYPINTAINLLLQDTGLTPRFSKQLVLHIAIENKGKNMNATNSKKRQTVLAGLVGLFAATGGVSSAMAQGDEAATAQGRIDEIIVTASKREQSLQDVPMSVAALTGENLKVQGITDLQSLSLAVPGLMVAESGSFQRRISIRGIGNTFGSSSLVGMYIDETSVASIPDNQLDLRVKDVERVEVLKGPQGTLYGEGSVGGTIRYITKDPDMDDFAGNISLDGSVLKDGDASQEVGGIANIPLVKDSLGLRVVGQYVNSGGWIDQPALSKKDINDYELFNIRAKLLWKPSDNLTIKTTAIVHRNDVGAQNTGEDENRNYQQSFDDPTTPSAEDDYDLLNLLINYDIGSVSLVSSTSYLDSDKQRNNFGNQCCFPTGTPGELWHLLFPFDKKLAEVWTQELRISSNLSGPWHWTTGIFYKDATFMDDSEAIVGIPSVFQITLMTQSEDTSESWAIFGETGYKVTDKLELGAGLRYFEDKREFQGGMLEPMQKETFNSLNPKLYISYYPTSDIHLYANVAKGFRSGGFNVAGLPSYDPEDVLSYELGLKSSAIDGRLNVELAIFHSDYDDYQIVGVIPTIGNITSNAGNAELRGADLSLKYLVTDALELGFTGNYIDSKFTEINATSTSHLVGDPLDLVPQYGFSLWSSYSFNWFDHSPGFLRVDYSQQGKSHYRNRSFSSDYHSTSDIIDTLNVRLGWEHNAVSLELYALNLLDENGFIGPFANELNSARPRPRTIGVNLGYSF